MTSILFSPQKIKNVEIKNRFVRSATADRAAEPDGRVSEAQIGLFSQLAEGGLGLIVTGIAYIHPGGRSLPIQMSIAEDRTIPGLRRLTDAVHERGAKIAVQLTHAGRHAAGYLNSINEEAVAPTYVESEPTMPGRYRAMTADEIWETILAFGDAASRAKEAGFDAVQLHGAHAYLFSQFLSPFSNRRRDEWGGSFENRLRFHREVYLEMRKRVGEDYPLCIKLGVQDGFEGGLPLNEGVSAARLLAEWGFDALEISQGLRGEGYGTSEYRTGIDSPEKEGYFRSWCRDVKRQVSIPVMMVGGLRSFDVMEDAVIKGEADFVALCRPLIREPGLINEWKRGSRRRALCISCNKCREGVAREKMISCTLEEK